MRTISLHPASAVVGAAFVGVVLLVTGAMQAPAATATQGGPLPRPVGGLPFTIDGAVTVLGIPNPRQAVVIKDTTPFVVPPGKVLQITALGLAEFYFNKHISLLIDGVTEVSAFCGGADGSSVTGGPLLSPSMTTLPSILVVTAGKQVTVASAPGTAPRAWGYLTDL